MTQPNVIHKPGRNRLMGCLLALVLLLILLGIGGAFAATQLQPPDMLGLQVSVLAPQAGALTEVNRSILVNASASYSAGLTRLELYVDGALLAVQQPPSADHASSLTLERDWLPKTTGRHILVARAYGRDSAKADSPIDYVDVVDLVQPTAHSTVAEIPQIPTTQHPSLNQVAQGLGIPINQLQSANPGLSGVNPDAPLPPDTPVDFPRSPAPAPAPGTPDMTPMGDDPGAVPPAPLPGTPTAPTNLNAVADCTTAQLTWADSPDEEQYVIYRLGPSDMTLNQIATLPQNSTSFHDTLSELGDYRYQVAAVRGGMEGLSPMGTAHTPDLCTPPAAAAGTADLVLSLITLQTDTPYDRVHCYLQVDGAAYERVPTDDFAYLASDPTDSNHLRYDLGRQPAGGVPNRGEIRLARHTADAPLTFNADCIGGGSSIGTLTLSVPREQWDGTIREATSTHWHLRYRIGPNSRPYLRDDLARLIGGILPAETIVPRPHIDPGSIRALDCDGCNPALGGPSIFRVDLSRDACGDIYNDPTLAGHEAERDRALLGCIVFGGETAYWSAWVPIEWLPSATTVGIPAYIVRAQAMNITTRATTLNWTKIVSVDPLPLIKMALVPPAPCNSAIRYSVSALVDVDGVRQQTEFGRDYTVVNTTPCAIEVTVTFDQVIIGPFHHDCFPFCPARPSVPSTIQFQVARDDRSDRYHTLMTQLDSLNSDHEGGVWLGEGRVDLASQFFRRDVYTSPDPWRHPEGLMDFGLGETWANVDLSDPTQAILIHGNISDRSFYPFLYALPHGGLTPSAYCTFHFQIDARPFAQWVGANLPFHVRTGGDSNYTDFCDYSFHVTTRALAGSIPNP